MVVNCQLHHIRTMKKATDMLKLLWDNHKEKPLEWVQEEVSPFVKATPNHNKVAYLSPHWIKHYSNMIMGGNSGRTI